MTREGRFQEGAVPGTHESGLAGHHGGVRRWGCSLGGKVRRVLPGDFRVILVYGQVGSPSICHTLGCLPRTLLTSPIMGMPSCSRTAGTLGRTCPTQRLCCGFSQLLSLGVRAPVLRSMY